MSVITSQNSAFYRIRALWLKAILVLITVGLYAQSLSFDFAYDDYLQISLNPTVTNATLSTSTLRHIILSPTPPGNLYRPVTTLSYAVNHIVSGLNPAPYHFINIILYAVICVLLFDIFCALFSSRTLAFVAAAIFAVHPLHVEAVANVIGRAELLSTTGILIAILCFHGISLSESILKTVLLTLVSSAATTVAILSKESAICALPLLILFPFYSHKTATPCAIILRRVGLGWVPACVVAIATMVLRHHVLGPNFFLHSDGNISVENPLLTFSFSERLLPSLSILKDYLGLLLFPIHSSADYSIMPDQFLQRAYSPYGLLGLGALAFFLAFLWRSKSQPYGILGVWFLLTFASTINLLTPIGTLMADRLAFLPSCGFVGFLVGATAHLVQSTFVRRSATLLYLTALTCLTLIRIPVWRDNSTLFQQTIIDNPNSPKAFYNYGVHLYLHSDNPDDAETYFRQALARYPNYILPARAMADLMLRRGDGGRLEYWYRKLLELDPNDQVVHDNLKKLLDLNRSRGADIPSKTTK